jgi:hypothetical protein
MAVARRAVALAALLGLAGAGTALAPAPAAAGFFEQLFDGFRHAFSHRQQPRHAEPFDNPFSSLARALSGEPAPGERIISRETGPTRGFCVRTCDGHFFPVQAHPGMSAADACRSFCPASETKLYSGSNIDYATTSDGSRYADLANAYRYRKQLVAGCTCNGRTAFGLAHVEVARDPTLRPGDVVATKDGFMAVEGGRDRSTAFTPVAGASLPKAERAALSHLRVTQDYGVPRNEPSRVVAPEDERNAQLAK